MTRYFMSIALCIIAPLAPAEIVCSENIFSMQQQKLPTEGWHIKYDKNDFKIYNRKISGKKIREVLAMAELELSARRLFTAISDYDHYSEFMPYVKKSRVLQQENNKSQVFQELDFPWPIANRHYTIDLTADTTQSDQGHYFVSWSLAQKEPGLPKGKGVPLAINDGYWKLCTVGKNKTYVEYHIHTDPGGILPSWAVNKSNTKAVPDVFGAVEKRANSSL